MERAKYCKLFIIHLQFNNISAGECVLVRRFLKGNASADIVGSIFLLSSCWKMLQQFILYSCVWIHFLIWSLALKVREMIDTLFI